MRLRELWRVRAGVVAAVLAGLAAAVWSVHEVRLVPPSLAPRSVEMASASTHVVVDTPASALLDLRQDTYSLEGLTNRAVLLGNVMASQPLRRAIARRAGVPAGALEIAAPLTTAHPRPRAEGGARRSATDILRTGEQYRLTIVANATVPILDLYAQTPTARTAAALADAAVDELRAHLARLAAATRTPPDEQIRIVQLGRARGAVVNEGVAWQVALLAFLLTGGAACGTVVLLGRIRRGWRLAAAAEGGAAAPR